MFTFARKEFLISLPLLYRRTNLFHSQIINFNNEKISKNLWKLGRLNHIAIATSNLKKSTALYRDVLGATVSEELDLPDHGVTTVFVELNNIKIELLQPLGKNSPIQKFLDKNQDGGMHHICLEVNNIKEAMMQLRNSGVRTLTAEPKIGAHGKPVVFLHPKDCHGVLLELEEV